MAGIICLAGSVTMPSNAQQLCIYTADKQKVTMVFKDIEGLASSDFRNELRQLQPQIECMVDSAGITDCKTAWGGNVSISEEAESTGKRIFVRRIIDKEGRPLRIAISSFGASPQFFALTSKTEIKKPCGKYPIGKWLVYDTSYMDSEDNAHYIINGKRRSLAIGIQNMVMLGKPKDASGGLKGSF